MNLERLHNCYKPLWINITFFHKIIHVKITTLLNYQHSFPQYPQYLILLLLKIFNKLKGGRENEIHLLQG